MNDQSIEIRRTGRLAFTGFAQHSPFGAGALAGTLTADFSPSLRQAFLVGGADGARIEPREQATPVGAALAPDAWIHHRAFGIAGTPLLAASPLATLKSRHAVDNGRDADTIDTIAVDARVVVFAAAVPFLLAWPDAGAIAAHMLIGAAAGAIRLLRRRLPRTAERDGDRRESQPDDATAMASHAHLSRQVIEPMLIH